MERFTSQVLVLIIAVSVFAHTSPAFAQSDEVKNFMSMYFTPEELVVQSVTRSPKPISQVAENVTVVTAADIELMNAHSVADVLNTVTGVQVWMTGGPGQIATAMIQGSEQFHVTVILDGVVLNTLSDNIAELGILPVQNIEKIEIIKGPASSAWGSALGGVVNIITKAGGIINQGNTLSASYGIKNSGDLRAETRGKEDKFGYYLTAGRLQSNGLTEHFKVSDNNAYTKLTYDLTDKTSILFTLGYAETARGNGLDTLNDRSYDNGQKLMHSTLTINSALSNKVELNISFRTIRQEFTTGINLLSSGELLNKYKDEDNGQGASAKLTWKNTRNTFVLGADYDYKVFKSNSMTGGEQGMKKSAFYANDTLAFDKLSITPGIRYDNTSSNKDIISPSLGITYNIANSTILRASAARGFSLPPIGQTYGNTSSYAANPDLKMETVWSYLAGVETAAAKYIWIKVSAFRHEIRDGLTPEDTSAAMWTMINRGRQRRQGVDLEMKTAPVYNTALSAGAEFVDAKDLDTGLKLENVATRVYDVGLHYDDKESFKALLIGRYIDWNASPLNNAKYDSFIFDLHLIKKIFHRKDAFVEAFVDVHNLFHGSQYLVDYAKNPAQWFEGGLRYSF